MRKDVLFYTTVVLEHLFTTLPLAVASLMSVHVDAAQVARKMVVWGQRVRKSGRKGLPLLLFVRHALEGVQLGDELTTFLYGGRTYTLPPPQTSVNA